MQATISQRVVNLAALGLLALFWLPACHRNLPAAGAYDAVNQTNCLPPIALLDQHGNRVVLSDLKGKPVVVDFIYTSCPGPCLMLTQKMARVAAELHQAPGSGFRMVSITVDPEHDHPAQLATYIKSQGVADPNWLFLTGAPTDIDRVLADFQLRRQRAPDGSVGHITGIFVLGPQGRELRQYNGELVKPATVVADLHKIQTG